MKKLNVLYQSDNNYVIYMGVSILSLLENNQEMDEINVYIIDDAISDKNKDKINNMVNEYGRKVFYISVDKLLNDDEIVQTFSYTGMRKNKHSYFKLFVDKLLPNNNERIIYIDCDTAVTGYLGELVTMNMSGKPIGMVMDSLAIKSKKIIGFNDKDKYYNSGVILFDLQSWKDRNCSERILEHLKKIRTYGTVDQDVLNVELKGEIVTLPIKYNLQPIHLDYSNEVYNSVYRHKEDYYSDGEIKEAVKQPVIIHYLRYLGEAAWNENSLHPAKKYFNKYLVISPWADYEKEEANFKWIFVIERWMYLHLPKRIFLKIFFYIHENMIIRSSKRVK